MSEANRQDEPTADSLADAIDEQRESEGRERKEPTTLDGLISPDHETETVDE